MRKPSTVWVFKFVIKEIAYKDRNVQTTSYGTDTNRIFLILFDSKFVVCQFLLLMKIKIKS
jgi:hypothetical protein